MSAFVMKKDGEKMFIKKKKGEVIVRSVNEDFVKAMKQYHEQKAGIRESMKMLVQQAAELEKEKEEIWSSIYEEYSLSKKDTYSFDTETKEITRI